MRLTFLKILLVATYFILLGFNHNTAVLANEQVQNSTIPVSDTLLTPKSSDIILGSNNAPITIIEYSSLTCPHCSYFHRSVFPELKKEFIDTGKVRYIGRDFPLDEPALKAALLARCAGSEHYYTFIKVLFDSQETWSTSRDYQKVLENIARLGGFSMQQFQHCIKNKKLEDQIVESRLKATKELHISSTPTFFINGVLHSGSINFAAFAKLINERLNTD